jgi:hypothetical protein
MEYKRVLKKDSVYVNILNDNSEGRVDRIIKVLDRIAFKNLKNLESIKDHKGTLILTWREIPTDRQFKVFGESWEREYELPENVINQLIIKLWNKNQSQ